MSDATDAVRRFLAARRAGDYDAALAEVTEDAVWWSPISGPETGRRRLREVLAAADEETDRFRSEVLELEGRGDRALARVRNVGRRGFRKLDSEQLLAFRLHDGRIAEVRIVVDDPEAVRAFWTGSAT